MGLGRVTGVKSVVMAAFTPVSPGLARLTTSPDVASSAQNASSRDLTSRGARWTLIRSQPRDKISTEGRKGVERPRSFRDNGI
jgi:hypothetical protein